MDIVFLAIVGISEVISIFCLYRLWKGHDKTFVKLLWSLVLAIPFLGPIFYGGFHNAPAPQSDDLKAPFTSETFWEDTHAHEHVGHGDSHDND